MICKNLDTDTLYKSVQNFSKLGTGRQGRKVIIGDSDDARTSTFTFVANIRHKWPSSDRVIFSNGEVFYISSQTIRGKRVYLFFWNELTENLWFQQVERTRLFEWLETARPEDVLALADLLNERSGSESRVWRLPELAGFYVRAIQIEIWKSNLRELRQLTGVIDQPVSTVPIESAKAA